MREIFTNNKRCAISILKKTINELSITNVMNNLSTEILFVLTEFNLNNIIILNYKGFNLNEETILADLEEKIKENILLSREKKSISIQLNTEKIGDILTKPIQKKNGEMIFFISMITRREINEDLILFIEMLVTTFYKNFIIQSIMNNFQDGYILDGKTDEVHLSPKESQVAHYLELGFTDKEIYQACHISLSTLRKIISSIYEKLNVNNRAEFISKYSAMKILNIYKEA
ncbi:DNA-binding NarL/FixJ family response regulator [Anaerosolibacter carboniphilus]|uniref:DNA-binding NarL/FixJ family response regulator n=1 Tax=Anaerosolibacter carboniphilus TaxID=1417629 RepID=A0A841KYK9_9FIRM|nr:helix-turn-helix transcriptional regulator [Anaerosolibacter carboniphilus]MBB6218437.1 DNA-binding NarL/FixJ family response regulator [Anaerosolibacter carboniphilus]